MRSQLETSSIFICWIWAASAGWEIISLSALAHSSFTCGIRKETLKNSSTVTPGRAMRDSVIKTIAWIVIINIYIHINTLDSYKIPMLMTIFKSLLSILCFALYKHFLILCCSFNNIIGNILFFFWRNHFYSYVLWVTTEKHCFTHSFILFMSEARFGTMIILHHLSMIPL